MGFDRKEVADLLARCHRRCCICHSFCGVKIEADHIKPHDDGGDDGIENAIPVCFDCHAEIHSYNDRHPRGRKFTERELRKHKEQWLDFCDRHPAALSDARAVETGVGPLQALVDEIEFNLAVAKAGRVSGLGCPLRDEQFSRVLRTGSIALLLPDLKAAIIDAYVAVGHASVVGEAAIAKKAGGMSRSLSGTGSGDPHKAFHDCEELLTKAYQCLLKFLGHDEEAG